MKEIMSDYKNLTPYTIRQAQNGNPQALNTVAAAFDSAFQAMARGLTEATHYGQDMIDDMTQEAQLALMEALPSFDPDKGTLQTFVYLKARRVMVDAMSGGVTGPSIPGRTLRRFLSGETGDLSNASHASIHNVLTGTTTLASSEDDYGDQEFRGVELASPDHAPDTVTRLFTERLMEGLGERELFVLRCWTGMETGYPLTLEDIGGILGVDTSTASRIKSAAIRKLQQREADRETGE